MAYRDFTNSTMVELSSAWVDPEKNRSLLAGFPQTAGLLSNLDQTHANIVRVAPTEDALRKQIDDLTKALFDLDKTHDRKRRGVYHVLTGLSDLVDDPTRQADLITLRDAILPNGLQGTQVSYIDQAGNARILEQRLTDTQRAALEAINVLDTNLMLELAAMLDAAKLLGDKVEERRPLQARFDQDPNKITPIDVLNARNAWVRTARLIEQVLHLTDATEAQLDLLLGPLHEANRKVLAARPTEPDTDTDNTEIDTDDADTPSPTPET